MVGMGQFISGMEGSLQEITSLTDFTEKAELTFSFSDSAKSAHLIPSALSETTTVPLEVLKTIQNYVLYGYPLDIDYKLLAQLTAQRPTVVIRPTKSGISIPNDTKGSGLKLLEENEASIGAVLGRYEKVTAKIVNDTVIATAFPIKKESTKKNAEIKALEWVLRDFGTSPTAVALDPEGGLFVGTQDGSLHQYAIDSFESGALFSQPFDSGKIHNIKIFNSSKFLLVKNTENFVKIWNWKEKERVARIVLNAPQKYGHDYLFNERLVRSHYDETWGVTALLGSSSDAVYELPVNYLMGNDFAKPAVMYAVLLQSLMLQKKASVSSKSLILALPGAYARSAIEPSILAAYELCLAEQATRLGNEFVPHAPFSITKKI
jgi:hypothetical protein